MMRFLVSILLLLLSVPAYAVQLEGLYTAQVAVDDQSQSVRNQAIKKALHTVVRKVSGRRSTLNNSPLLEALSNVGSYVEQFQYKKRDQDNGYWLIVRFQKAALDRTLQQFDVPVWGANRPDVLLWLAVDDGNDRYILNSSTGKELADALKQESLDAGLAVTLPLLDLADQRAVSFNDIRAGFSEQIALASQRYSTNQVIFARLLKTNGIWQLNWTWLSEGRQYDGVEKSSGVSTVFQPVFIEMTEKLADIYAPMGIVSLEKKLTIELIGVDDLLAFTRATGYLSSLDMVKKLNWEQLQGNKVVLNLVITGDESVLIQTIALNDVLSPGSSQRIVAPVSADINSLPAQPLEKVLYYRVN